MIEQILKDLRQIFGDKVLLEPEDLVEVLGISVGQQANLRSTGRFPIRTQKVGGRIKISIYDLAKFLSGEATASVKQEIKMMPDKLNRTQKKAKKGHLEGAWWSMQSSRVIAIIRKSQMDYELEIKENFKNKNFGAYK